MALRWAYEVPDIINDENARSYIAQRIGQTGEVLSLDPLEASAELLETIDFVLTLGAEGALDIVVLNENIAPGAVCNAHATRLIGDQKVEAVVRQQAPRVISTLCSRVRAESAGADLEHNLVRPVRRDSNG
jgi:hypothetical protein